MEGVEGCHKEERGEGGALGSAPVGWDGGEDLSIEGRLRGGAVEFFFFFFSYRIFLRVGSVHMDFFFLSEVYKCQWSLELNLVHA